MADKVAGIKVKVNPDKGGLRDLDKATKDTATSMKASLSSALSEGMKGGKEAVKSLLGDIKSGVGTIAGLLGGLGTAELVRGALEANSKWGDLKFGIQAATGSAHEFAAVQKQLQAAALATGHDSMKMVDVFEGVRRETGSLELAKETIDNIATAARGAHKPLESMGNIAGTLNEKFDITAEEMPGALADVVGLSEKGGIGFEDMAEKLGLVGAYAKEAGLSGRAGFGQMIGLLNMADNANGNFKKGLTGVGTLLEQLGNNVSKAKIGAALGISGGALKGDAMSQIEAIMKATKGQKSQLEKAFGGETLKLLVDMGKTYSTAFDETKGNVKTKSEAATNALRSALGDASKSAVKWSDIQNEAASQMNEAPQKIATATEKFRQAFQSEKFQAALGKIIDRLPQLAEILANLVGMAVDNPLGAGMAVLGGTFAKGAIGSVIEGAFKTGAASAGTSIATAIAGSAGSWSQVAALAGGPIGMAIAASIGIALAAAIAEAKSETKRREGAAKDAQAMLKGGTRNEAGQLERGTWGAYQAAGALEAATGIEADPTAVIDAATQGRATSGQDARDKQMEERLLAKGKRANADMVAGNALAAKFGWGTPTESQGVSIGAPTGGVSTAQRSMLPTVERTPEKTAAFDPAVVAAAMANGVASKELKVRVTNSSDFGVGGSPTGGIVLPPGWKPR